MTAFEGREFPVFCIDSYGWIEYFTGGRLAEKYAALIEGMPSSNCIVPSIVFFEVYKRIKGRLGSDAAAQAVCVMLLHAQPVNVDEGLVLLAADISLEHGLGMTDALIKASCEQCGAVLVTSDKHFKGMKGVKFVE